MLGRTREEWEAHKGLCTAEEILQQPETWRKTIALLQEKDEPLRAFIQQVTKEENYRIILTGAGTSEYVGNALFPALVNGCRGNLHSIGTTDIVASPEAFIPGEGPLLLVSFARSGNSPESVGAVKAADRINPRTKHLFVTCNRDGALAKLAEGREDCFSLLLAPETHDRGFAMTSSFTNMYLAALLALSPREEQGGEKAAGWEDVIRACAGFLSEGAGEVNRFVADSDFDRIVYLGSDVLKGIAQESALKILELTAGRIAAFHDTPMGFRHGPKSVIDDGTVTVVYLSENPLTRRYEMDLLREVYRDRGKSRVVCVASRADEEVRANCDLVIPVDGWGSGSGEPVPNCRLALPYMAVAQTLAILCSLKLGITPDNPCPTGEVNRVVQGVTIYE